MQLSQLVNASVSYGFNKLRERSKKKGYHFRRLALRVGAYLTGTHMLFGGPSPCETLRLTSNLSNLSARTRYAAVPTCERVSVVFIQQTPGAIQTEGLSQKKVSATCWRPPHQNAYAFRGTPPFEHAVIYTKLQETDRLFTLAQ